MGTDVKPHRIAGKMTPFFTETELEVAVILNELTGILRDPGHRPLDTQPLRWGARRLRRRGRSSSSSSPPAAAAIPEDDPSPSTSLLAHRPRLDHDDRDDETKGDAAAAAAAAAGAAAGSPLSPLSFTPSGGEEPESCPPPPPPPPPNLPATKPSSKNSKHPNERIKELRNTIAVLYAERNFLRQERDQFKIKCTMLRTSNDLLRERSSKENQTALPEPPSTVGAPPADSPAARRQGSPAKRKVEFEFDLNKIPEEEEEAAADADADARSAANADADAAARSACKAAISAEARRRRMEIQRAKSAAAAAAAAAGSMPWTAHKMPRLR